MNGTPLPPQTQSPAQPAAPKASTIPIPPSQVAFTPPLVTCLAIVARMHGKPVPVSALEAGLPRTRQETTPYACIRAARREGISAQIVHKPILDKIASLNLPCILLLNNDEACILTAVNSETARLISPETPDVTYDCPIGDIISNYTGYAVFARPRNDIDPRVRDIGPVNTKKWFWGTILHFLPIYKHVILASVFINLLAISTSIFTMNVYDRVVPNNAVETLWVLAVGVGLAIFFDFVLRNLRSYFVDIAGRNADILIGSKIMSHIMSLRMDYKPESTGSMINNIKEFDSLREFFSSTTLLALVDLPFLVLFIVIIAFIGGPIAIIPSVAAPIVILMGMTIQKPLMQAVSEGYKEASLKYAMLVETISGLETIKTSRAEGPMLGRWERIIGMGAKSAIQSRALSTFSLSFTQFASQLVTVGQVIWGVYLIGEGSLTTGGLIACSILVGRAMGPLASIAAMMTRLQQSRIALKSLDTLMQLPSERPEGVQHMEYNDLRPTITFEDVSFMYPGALLNAVSFLDFHIAQGERVAIIGKMGSGKTTLGKLINGLYTPQRGAVKVGGIDIRQMDPAELRHKIGYMSQDNYLFYGTIRDNITLGAPHVSDQALLRAATIAGVTDFVKSHPAGFNMQVGERGLSLSGGQRQAVTIARTLLLDPEIIILDEPSSSMDTGVEAILKLRLATALKGKTLILITHRPSLLPLATRVIALEDGKIIADGPRNDVLAQLQKRGNGAQHG